MDTNWRMCLFAVFLSHAGVRISESTNTSLFKTFRWNQLLSAKNIMRLSFHFFKVFFKNLCNSFLKYFYIYSLSIETLYRIKIITWRVYTIEPLTKQRHRWNEKLIVRRSLLTVLPINRSKSYLHSEKLGACSLRSKKILFVLRSF